MSMRKKKMTRHWRKVMMRRKTIWKRKTMKFKKEILFGDCGMAREHQPR